MVHFFFWSADSFLELICSLVFIIRTQNCRTLPPVQERELPCTLYTGSYLSFAQSLWPPSMTCKLIGGKHSARPAGEWELPCTLLLHTASAQSHALHWLTLHAYHCNQWSNPSIPHNSPTSKNTSGERFQELHTRPPTSPCKGDPAAPPPPPSALSACSQGADPIPGLKKNTRYMWSWLGRGFSL